MNEAELIEAINPTLAIQMSVLMGYISIVTGYLFAAFVVGARLTPLQTLIVSCLFVFASVMCTGAIWGSGSRIAYMVSGLLETDPLHPIIYSQNFRNGMTLFCTLGILASLKFMWDVRLQRE